MSDEQPGDPTGAGPRLVLMIVADQLRADHLGFGGLDIAHTPNLDALAGRGTIFERAHVTNPICMPNRAALATGRWPSVHGTRTNGIPLDRTAETVVGRLRGAGWHTAAVGKLHLQTMGWPAETFQMTEIDSTNPATIDPRLSDARDAYRGDRLDWEDIARHRDELVEMPVDYYGFSSTELVLGHGDRASGHYWHWVRNQGFDPDPVGGYDNAIRRSETWDHVWESRVPAAYSTSRYVAERTVAQIEAAAARSEPTFVFASFPDPHHPFCPPEEYARLVDPADIALPSTFYQDPARLPPHLQSMLGRRGVPNPDPMLAFAATEEQYREALVAEVGLMAMLDAAVGEMLAAVERVGLADDAVVVFTADHGDLFGDHGLMLKHHVHYGGVTRVPLVVTGGGATPRRCPALVSTADIAATVLDIAGVSAYRGLQGRSLSPLLDGRADTHRDALVVEEDQPFAVDGLDAPVRMRSLVADDGRLTIYHGEPFGELYLFDDDVDEVDNRFADSGCVARRESMRERLLDEAFSLADEGLRMLHGA